MILDVPKQGLYLTFCFTRLGAMVAHIPWSTVFVKNITNPGGRGMAVYDLSQKMVGNRLEAGSSTEDLFYHLVRQLIHPS